jgi:hypothetical protein
MEMAKVAFYVKCRPQGANAWKIAKRAQRVFLGYPIYRQDRPSDSKWRDGMQAQIHGPHTYVQWLAEKSPDYPAQASRVKNFSQSIAVGSIAMVPRVQENLVHVARVVSAFEVVDQPDWADEYLDLRKEQKLEEKEGWTEVGHIADVVQSWKIDEWKSVPYTALPRWISHQLLSRNTMGEIKPNRMASLQPYEVMDAFLESGEHLHKALVGNKTIQEALISVLTPSGFEHLCVSLLQLEYGDAYHWHHVGGSGDGGVDGIGIHGKTGAVAGVVQCKWFSSAPPESIGQSMVEGLPETTAIHVVILDDRHLENKAEEQGRVTFWGASKVGDLITRHRQRLPLSSALLAAIEQSEGSR